jgi:4-carboxymuconolactone decarboxylase
MSRLAPPDRVTLSAEDQAIWDGIDANHGGVNRGPARGPSAVMMNVPELAQRVFHTENYFRTVADLPAADRELVILAVAREFEARYAWARHEARGRQENVRPETIEILRGNGPLDGLTERERTLVELVRALLRTKEVPEPLYRRLVDELGQKQLVEAIALIGSYCTVGLFIKTFEIPEDSPTF